MRWSGLGLILLPGFALAHSTERGLVLLLPTELYLIGGALTVLASFVLLGWIPVNKFKSLWLTETESMENQAVRSYIPSLISLSLLVALIMSGMIGTRDPLTNPLVISTWTLWWVLFLVVQCLTGDLWQYLNPWTGICCVLRRRLGLRPQYLKLPPALGYGLAIGCFSAFAWFELVDLSPEDPSRLAKVMGCYWMIHFAGILLFGDREWLSRAEPFAIFFRLIGCLSPFVRNRTRTRSDPSILNTKLVFPGTKLLRLPALSVSGVLFVLLTLSSVSFDGFARTFFWLNIIDINPLEYPGRTAVVLNNTLGLIAAFTLLTIIYFGCVYLGCRVTNNQTRFREFSGIVIYSIIPISLAFHCAHYLTQLLVNAQYAVLAFNDPFNLNWDLFGATHFHVTTSFLNQLDTVKVIWGIQTAVIVLGHVVAIVIAHVVALRICPQRSAAVRSQIALALFMVGYTVFGLWLLSTPSIG